MYSSELPPNVILWAIIDTHTTLCQDWTSWPHQIWLNHDRLNSLTTLYLNSFKRHYQVFTIPGHCARHGWWNKESPFFCIAWFHIWKYCIYTHFMYFWNITKDTYHIPWIVHNFILVLEEKVEFTLFLFILAGRVVASLFFYWGIVEI